MQNSGDDAFCEVAAWGASKYWNAKENLFFSSSIPKMVNSGNFYSPHANYRNFIRAIKDIFASDVFVSAGGSTFHSKLKITDLRSYAKAKKYIPHRGKIGAIGISLGPYKNLEAEKSTKAYLRKLDFLALRDQRSYEIAQSYNLSTTPILAFDLAALLPQIHPLRIESHKEGRDEIKIIGISLCNYESYTNGDKTKEKNRNDFILNILKRLMKNKNILFRFFIFNGNKIYGDEKLTNDSIGELLQCTKFSYEIIPYLGDVGATYTKINECDFIISTRLHASIFACYGGTPFILLEYHRKCTDFLNDVGHNQIYRVNDGDVSITSVCSAIDNILGNGKYQEPKFIKETRARALLNFTETI